MTSYHEQMSELRTSQHLRVAQLTKDVGNYLRKSNRMAKLNLDEPCQIQLIHKVETLLKNECQPYLHRYFADSEYVCKIPSFTICFTNSLPVFMHFLNAKKIQPSEDATGKTLGNWLIHQKYQWDSLLNDNALTNKAAQFGETHLLFGRKLSYHRSSSSMGWSEEKREFRLLLYLPATPGEKLVTIKNSLEDEVRKINI
jgi:hypothetical protein